MYEWTNLAVFNIKCLEGNEYRIPTARWPTVIVVSMASSKSTSTFGIIHLKN